MSVHSEKYYFVFFEKIYFINFFLAGKGRGERGEGKVGNQTYIFACLTWALVLPHLNIRYNASVLYFVCCGFNFGTGIIFAIFVSLIIPINFYASDLLHVFLNFFLILFIALCLEWMLIFSIFWYFSMFYTSTLKHLGK